MTQRAILVLSEYPDDETANEIAIQITHKYGDPKRRVALWFLVADLPPWLTVGVADQVSAFKRDAGEDAVYMAVYMCTKSEAEAINYE